MLMEGATMRLQMRRRHRWSLGTLLALLLLLGSLGQTVLAEYAYVIQEGDTIETIAWDHDVTVAELIELNGLENPDLIITGDTMWIPDHGAYADWAEGGGALS